VARSQWCFKKPSTSMRSALISRQKQFDLIFSNFGGLNCLSEVSARNFFFKNASALLSEKRQKLALVVMPKKYALGAIFTFFSKAKFGEMSRRKKKIRRLPRRRRKVSLTYYYNPEETVRLADYYF
jgi:hypothetical protein